MDCYELSLTSDYCHDWEFGDAMRELIQNGIDQEVLNSRNKFSIRYNSENEEIVLRNDNSKLKVNTLLLGKSGKANNEDTVGQFGEGYKIAALVLNRLGKTFTIFNREKNEVWESRFKNSEKWREKILAFYISTNNDQPDDALEIVVGNVTEDEYVELQNVWIGFCESYEKIETSYGEIITDDEFSGKVFVNGLTVDINTSFEFGYNFKPKYIKLERDRKTCDSWNAQATTAHMLSEAMINGLIEPELIREMVSRDSDDTYHLDWISERNHFEEYLVSEFDKENPDSIPVNSQNDFEKVKKLGGNPIIVPYRIASIIKTVTDDRIRKLMNAPAAEKLTLKEKFYRWLTIYENKLDSKSKKELTDLIDKIGE